MLARPLSALGAFLFWAFGAGVDSGIGATGATVGAATVAVSSGCAALAMSGTPLHAVASKTNNELMTMIEIFLGDMLTSEIGDKLEICLTCLDYHVVALRANESVVKCP